MKQLKTNKVYMQYFCKNQKCGRIFLAEDLYGRMIPETFRYCDECEKIGFPEIREDKKNKKMTRVTTFKKSILRGNNILNFERKNSLGIKLSNEQFNGSESIKNHEK